MKCGYGLSVRKPTNLVLGKGRVRPLPFSSFRVLACWQWVREAAWCLWDSLQIGSVFIHFIQIHQNIYWELFQTQGSQSKEDRHSPCSPGMPVLLSESGSELQINRIISHNNKRHEESNEIDVSMCARCPRKPLWGRELEAEAWWRTLWGSGMGAEAWQYGPQAK